MTGAILERRKPRHHTVSSSDRAHYAATSRTKKPDGKLKRQHKTREMVLLLNWTIGIGLIFAMGMLALNGFAILNAETRNKVEINQRIGRANQKQAELKAEYKQRTAPLDVASWAQESGMIPASNQKSLVLEPQTTPSSVMIGAITP